MTTEDVQAFTIEFDLRSSLVMRGNQNNNNGYILKPHGVSIVNNATSASLSGVVDTNLFDEGDCSTQDGNMVYLYSGIGLDASNLIDLVDPDDEEFSGDPAIPDDAIAPIGSTEAGDDGSYSFGFLETGSYTAVFVCDGNSDDSVEYDSDIVIPAAPTGNSPGEKLGEVTLAAGDSGVLNFDY